MLGDDFFFEVVFVNCDGAEFGDGDAGHLQELAHVESLRLSGTQITDDGLRHLKGMTGLRFLWLYDTHITYNGLEHLKRLVNLEQLWLDDTHIFFTPDHGAMDGSYGLLLIGPDLTDHCCKLPFIWKPAANADVPAAEVEAPVGIIDLAPTFCQIAGAEIPDWMESQPLPKNETEAKE